MLWTFLISSGFAQEAASAAKVNPLANLMPIAVVFLIFYFLMIRPQKRRLQEEQSMISSLGKGDEIFTKSGLIGTIEGMTEKVITLEIAQGVKVKILRNQVGGLAKKLFEKRVEKK